MGSRMGTKSVMIIAGEASGDQHGAKVVRAMRHLDPRVSFSGIGGKALEDAGVNILIEAAKLSVVGITEALAKLPTLYRGLSIAKRAVKRQLPDLLILIDFPDFNLNLAATAKKCGIPVLYYISPQIWAWRQRRIEKIGRRVDHVAVILPFEASFYEKHQIPVTFVGHPLVDDLSPSEKTDSNETASHPPTLGLLPGSRDKEVIRHLPIMLSAAYLLKERIDGLRVIVSRAHSVERELLTRIIGTHQLKNDVEVVSGPVGNVFEGSRIVVAASGTVTLEAAISGTPTVIVYKVSPMSFWLAKMLVRVRFIGLINLIADREIVPELIQHQATPKNIADTVFDIFCDRRRRDEMRRHMLSVSDSLGGPGASQRVARLAFQMMKAGTRGNAIA